MVKAQLVKLTVTHLVDDGRLEEDVLDELPQGSNDQLSMKCLKLEAQIKLAKIEAQNKQLELEAQNKQLELEAQNKQLVLEAQNKQLELEAQNKQLELEAQNKQLELEAQNKQLELEAQNKQLELEAQNKQLELEAQNKQLELEAQNKQLELEAQHKQLELEVQHKLEEARQKQAEQTRQLEIQGQKAADSNIEEQIIAAGHGNTSNISGSNNPQSRINKYVELPMLNEEDPEFFFTHFSKTAFSMNWLVDQWVAIMQS
ncbi:calponin homology domain-containing protein DDB_G0272472-like [Procambarus clarkii]|uniref:calponin homology domain-containing protein DDB_G0272472-like n=1 Tax=Procambarus clarkii TaxID=6728 RepID=UPI0037423E22